MPAPGGTWTHTSHASGRLRGRRARRCSWWDDPAASDDAGARPDSSSTTGDTGTSPPPDAGGEDAAPPPSDAGLGAFENEILAAHNAVRAGATPAPSPALAPLGWSAAAASTAEAWANGCMFQHDPSAGFGENIYAAIGTPTGTDVVDSWASEVSSYDYAANTCAGTCGHSTQIVWRDTTSVGCAIAACTTNSPFGGGAWTFVVCDYDPPGNVNGRRPY